jgi:hypothetical protein
MNTARWPPSCGRRPFYDFLSPCSWRSAPSVSSAIFAAYICAINLEEDQGARAFRTAVRESGASVADYKRLSTIMLNRASDAARRRLETMMTTFDSALAAGAAADIFKS